MRDDTRGKLSRRNLLRGASAALAAAAAGGLARLSAQVTGSTTGGGTVPLRLPAGALTSLDRKDYIRNLEIHAFLPGAKGGGSDATGSSFWVKGAQRMFVNGTDITDPTKPVAFKPSINANGSVAYVKRLKKWLSLGGASAPLTAPTPQFPRGQYDPEYANKSRSYTGPRGVRTFDVTDPAKPVLLQDFSVGKVGGGTHCFQWEGGRYAYAAMGWTDQLRMESSERPYSDGIMILDLQDPAHIKDVAKWWVPGQMYGEEAEYKKFVWAGDGSSWSSSHGVYAPKRPEDGGNILYAGMGHFGMYTLDISDIAHPKPVHRLAYELEAMGGIPHHTIYQIPNDPAYPRLQNLYISVFECLETDCREPWHTSYVIDATNPRAPKIIGTFPRPMPDPAAPYTDFCFARGRFSSHNIQPLMAPGKARPDFVALTYFSAGVRIYDISDPTSPKEVAYFVPGAVGDINQWESWRRRDTNVFIEWDRNLIWVATDKGLYAMSCPFLGKPVLEPKKVERWVMPEYNAGWDEQTPKTVYFGRSLSQMA